MATDETHNLQSNQQNIHTLLQQAVSLETIHALTMTEPWSWHSHYKGMNPNAAAHNIVVEWLEARRSNMNPFVLAIVQALFAQSGTIPHAGVPHVMQTQPEETPEERKRRLAAEAASAQFFM